ncbi:MAG: MJ1255/VC2487 family glycosyltransferase [bacterium]
MSKIIYGVAGQGFGHSTRSKEIIKYLISQGHEVLVFAYGQALFLLKEEFNTFEIPGLHLEYQDNRLRYRKTLIKNIKQFFLQTRDFKKISQKFKEFNPDLVITDFEPITTILSKLKKKPLISLDNQHQLTNTKIDLPGNYKKDFLADKMIVRSMVWGAKYYLVTSFFETEIKKKNTFLFPPIVRQEVLDLQPTKGDYILVYQPSNHEGFADILKKFNNKFIIFGYDLEKTDGNLEFKKYSSSEWLKYLSDCQAVVATAGLSLICEALYLKKPYLAIPIKRQIEQIINAIYLKKQGYGDFTYKFCQQDFNDFMKNLPTIEAKLTKYSHKDNAKIFNKIDELIKCIVSK